MRQHQETLSVRTTGRGLFEITNDVAAAVARSRVTTGLCVVFCVHTSASLLIQENADPAVQKDLLDWWERLAPDGDRRYAHDTEGPDDMPSHLRSAITRTSETIPISDGRLALGTWQGLYVVEHRKRAHTRRVVVHVLGSPSE